MSKSYLQNQSVSQNRNTRVEQFWIERTRKGARMRLYVYFALSILLLIGAAWGGAKLFRFLARAPLLYVKAIEINDLERVKRKEVVNLARLTERSNLLSLDLKEMHRRVMSHPWIKDVEITRFFPSTLKFLILEHKPQALIVLDEKLHFLDGEGSVIKVVEMGERRDFPVITGIQNLVAHLELIKDALKVVRLCQEILSNPISEIGIDPSSGFTLFTLPPASPEPFSPMQRSKIFFSFEDISLQMSRLSKVIADLRSKTLVANTVDLRFEEKVIVKINK